MKLHTVFATGALCAAALAFTAPAIGGGSDDAESDEVEKPMGGGLQPVKLEGRYDNPMRRAKTIEEFRDLPFEQQDYWGYEQLGLEPECVHEIREGLKLVYGRKYKKAREHFRSVDERWPEATTAATMDAMIWQAMMLENFDFRFDSQYEVATAQAREDLTAALAKPGFEGWEHFLMAGVIGIEAIHMVRKEKYVAALPVAFEAMDNAQKSREASPDFVDLKLADGIYNYWRTVVTESSKVLPDFGDHREEGIAQMEEVEAYAVFMDAPATLSLSFTWMEEGNFKRAVASTTRNKQAYPDNVINLLVHGQILTYMRRYDGAHEAWDHILEVDPKNNRVHYWRAVTYIRQGENEQAEESARRYLDSDHLEAWQKSNAYWRLGQAIYKQKRYGEARSAYKEAVSVDGNKRAKAALDRMKDAKKNGRIDY
ncbi:MAG: tetratricopeptide repeat protein [Deltaproteobacteria bacterium]|nr:MAG: tetratricopeptide repeat protein [Deltaproteobacteria bacterium]